MENNSLYDLIQAMEYGTNLHIGVLFFNNYGNAKCSLPKAHTIHSSPLCDEIKRNKREYKRCFSCRNLAIKKAFATRTPFGGTCINGVYEYIHPIMVRGEVACIVFIGNILEPSKGYAMLQRKLGEKVALIDSLEKNFSYEQCARVGCLLESYIRLLLEQYKDEDPAEHPLVESIKKYLETNLEYDVTIAHIAKIFHYNQQYIGRLFKKETGVSMQDYITEQRLERAKSLLEAGEASVTWIAGRVGFNNVTYFNRLFKRKYNMTPSQCRKKS